MTEQKTNGMRGMVKILIIALTVALGILGTIAVSMHTTAKAQITIHEIRISELERQRAADKAADEEWKHNVTATLAEIKADVKDLKK
jgi:Flp pilus assembly protein TadB